MTKKEKIMANEKIPYKIYLEESEMPTQWYNVRADMKKKPAPLLDPATGKPCTAEQLSHVFCDELAHLQRSTTSSRATTPAEATSSIPLSLRLTMQRSRA